MLGQVSVGEAHQSSSNEHTHQTGGRQMAPTRFSASTNNIIWSQELPIHYPDMDAEMARLVIHNTATDLLGSTVGSM